MRTTSSRAFEVVEQHLVGKAGEALCEDRVVVTDTLVAVVDGATDKSGLRWDVPAGPAPQERDVLGGRWAALLVEQGLRELDPRADRLTAVERLSAHLEAALQEQRPGLPDAQRPGASLVVFNAVRREVWRVGDCHVQVDGLLHRGGKEVDEVTSGFRALALALAQVQGQPTVTEAGGCVGRAAVQHVLDVQALLANREGPFGYGVLDGRPVPDVFVEQVPLPDDATELLLTSDGYPALRQRLPGSLEEAERQLRLALAADPSCVRELRGTKGLQAGAVSFDDRAWVRLRLPLPMRLPLR